MKTLTKTIAALTLGVSLAALTVSAGSYNLSVSAGGGNSDSNGGDPYVPAGADVGWYAYSYGSAYAHVEVYGGGVFIDGYSPYNGSDGGSAVTNSATSLTIRLSAQSSGGSAGGGVTVNW